MHTHTYVEAAFRIQEEVKWAMKWVIPTLSNLHTALSRISIAVCNEADANCVCV